MGTRAAHNFANIFMGKFEETHIYHSEFMKHIGYYGRYIDDIYLIWKGSEHQLK